jgi:hypothetical protein
MSYFKFSQGTPVRAVMTVTPSRAKTTAANLDTPFSSQGKNKARPLAGLYDCSKWNQYPPYLPSNSGVAMKQ